MIFLPSRGRPKLLERFIAAAIKTEMTLPVVVAIDEDDSTLTQYKLIDLPPNVAVQIMHPQPLTSTLNTLVKLYPGEEVYGLVADDCVPLTNHWDRLMRDAAMQHGIAWANDLITTPGHNPRCSHCFLRGDLVRDIGWLCPPGFHHLYIDNVWSEIADRLGIGVYLDRVVLEHLHFSTNRAEYDSTYKRHSSHAADDRRAFENFMAANLSELTTRLRSVCDAK